MEHVMIDIETLSTQPDAAVLSIGAVAFDPYTGDMGEEFYVRFKFEEVTGSGHVSIDTLKWWFGQSAEAGGEAVSGTAKMDEGMEAFDTFIRKFGPDVKVWGNGSNFDIVILESLLRRMQRTVPWKFYNARDCRTVEGIARGIVNREEVTRDGVHHNALDDAKYQAKYISAMYNGVLE